MGWLMVVCESHGLDGISFVAAHYHIAMQSRRLVRPLRALDEARLRAMARALAGLPLPLATAAVEEGRIVDTANGKPVQWEPVATVLPVSERLRSIVSAPDYEETARREAGRLAFSLAPNRPAPTRTGPRGRVEPDGRAHVGGHLGGALAARRSFETR